MCWTKARPWAGMHYVQILLSCNLVNNRNVSWACCLQPNNTWINLFIWNENGSTFICFQCYLSLRNLETADTTNWFTEERNKLLCFCGQICVVGLSESSGSTPTFTCALLYTILPPHARGSWPLKKKSNDLCNAHKVKDWAVFFFFFFFRSIVFCSKFFFFFF